MGLRCPFAACLAVLRFSVYNFAMDAPQWALPAPHVVHILLASFLHRVLDELSGLQQRHHAILIGSLRLQDAAMRSIAPD